MKTPEVDVRVLERPDEMRDCVALYETVFSLTPADGSLNPRLLVGIAKNGGSVLGAYAGGEMIGFTLSFLARESPEGALYQYSQLATVAAEWQGRGVGRRLKFAQRDATRAMGLHEIRWAFDPFQPRNAHFNLDVLGAEAIALERDFYGNHGHGLDSATSTPRLIASWSLDDEAPRASDAWDAPDVTTPTLARRGNGATLLVPTSVFAHDDANVADRDATLAMMAALFSEGLVANSCQRHASVVAYAFTPRARAREAS